MINDLVFSDIEYIGVQAFGWCSGIKKVVFPEKAITMVTLYIPVQFLNALSPIRVKFSGSVTSGILEQPWKAQLPSVVAHIIVQMEVAFSHGIRIEG